MHKRLAQWALKNPKSVNWNLDLGYYVFDRKSMEKGNIFTSLRHISGASKKLPLDTKVPLASVG
eukprot:4056835-Lingulodinium_polyedra.AAC.1